MITSGSGKYKVWLEIKKIEKDILCILGGGEQSHIGSIVIAQPDEKTQVIRLSGHLDDIVLQPLAEAACKKYRTTVAAVGGIHIDNATKQEIELIVKNCKELIKCI
jgi:gallate decarboxylase subunit D